MQRPPSQPDLHIAMTAMRAAVRMHHANPFTSILTVSMGMQKPDVVTCTVRAVTGQALLTRRVAPAGGSSTITLDLASLVPGSYLLEIETDGERIVRKVVKE